MAEWIQMPSDARLDAKLLEQIVMTRLHVVDDVWVIGTSLVVHTPPSIHELKLSIQDELPDISLHLFSLVSPPQIPEAHFDLCEFALRVTQQLLDGEVDDQFHVANLDIVAVACVVLVDGLQPTNIIVRMRNQVHKRDITPWLMLIIRSMTMGPVGIHGSGPSRH